MQKIRILPTLLYRNPTLVKGESFESWRRVGSVTQAIRVYNMRGVDELVFLDIAATIEGRGPDFALIDELADDCFMPLTVGGGIRSIDDVRRLLQVGADKISLNSAAVRDPKLISMIADKFGSQCVVVSIDYREKGSFKEVYINSGTVATGQEPLEWASQAASLGAGEILLTSIERDGLMKGYDIETLRSVAGLLDIPVIASGGAGSYADFYSALHDGKASAVAAASIYHFTEQTPLEAKQYLHERGVNVRL